MISLVMRVRFFGRLAGARRMGMLGKIRQPGLGGLRPLSRRPAANIDFLLIVVVLLILATPALAWGPGTHLTMASDLLGNLWVLPAAVASIISRHKAHYRYGTVAADVVFAKKLSKVKQICHHWSTGFGILEEAPTDEDKAFAYGYLSHLAADTVAHNKYLPHQMALSGSTINFGHLYWEVRADNLIEPENWKHLRELLGTSYPGASSLLERRLQGTLLSFPANKALFTRMNMLVSMRSWRRSVQFWSRVSRWPLPPDLLAAYRAESLERIADVLNRGRASSVLNEDPNGNLALLYARVRRKQLRRLKRARLPTEHVVREAAEAHAPRHRQAQHPRISGQRPEDS